MKLTEAMDLAESLGDVGERVAVEAGDDAVG